MLTLTLSFYIPTLPTFTNMKHTKVLILLLTFSVSQTFARPDPDASPDPLPEAEADPDAEAIPHLYGSYIPTMAINPQQIAQTLPMPINSGASAGQCSTMVDQCCNMANQGCCPYQQITQVNQPGQQYPIQTIQPGQQYPIQTIQPGQQYPIQTIQPGQQFPSQSGVKTGQQCYTTYERKCRYANKPVCQTMSETKCDDHPIKACRFVQEKQYVKVPVTQCKLVNERTCFQYNATECKSKGNTYNHNFTWVNQELETEADKQIEKCHSVKTCKVTTNMEQRIQKVPKQECEKIEQPRKVCNSVAIPQPPQVIPTMDYRTDYRQQCYRIPKPVCRQVPCQYHVVKQNICPTCTNPNYGGGPCSTPSCPLSQGGSSMGVPVMSGAIPAVVGGPLMSGVVTLPAAVGGPVMTGAVPLPAPLGGPVLTGAVPLPAPVGGGDMCGACRSQNVQMCQKTVQKCEMEYETVCQQVPFRVPVSGTRTIPSPPKYEMKCDTITDTIDQCKTVYVDKTVEVPVQSCQQGQEKKCFQYSVPQHTVVDKDAMEMVKFETRQCDIATVPREHCAMLPTRMDCKKQEVNRAVLIRKKVCDRTKLARYCNVIPFSKCINNPGQECTMEPRQVCVPTSSCQQSSYCNQCSQFVNNGGYSQCSTPKCPNYYVAPGYCPSGRC